MYSLHTYTHALSEEQSLPIIRTTRSGAAIVSTQWGPDFFRWVTPFASRKAGTVPAGEETL
jgi:hypothetical protein